MPKVPETSAFDFLVDSVATAHMNAEVIDKFMEVNRLPPPAAMPVSKPR